jgi:hypothetical protein
VTIARPTIFVSQYATKENLGILFFQIFLKCIVSDELNTDDIKLIHLLYSDAISVLYSITGCFFILLLFRDILNVHVPPNTKFRIAKQFDDKNAVVLLD